MSHTPPTVAPLASERRAGGSLARLGRLQIPSEKVNLKKVVIEAKKEIRRKSLGHLDESSTMNNQKQKLEPQVQN